MQVDAALLAVLAAGGLGALYSHVSSASAHEAPSEGRAAALQDRARVERILQAYPHVLSPALLAFLVDPLELFLSLDEPTALDLLRGLDDLGAAYDQSCTRARPTLLAAALGARRRAERALATLETAARRTRPLAASDLAEDFKAIRKHIADSVHNIDQEIGFQLVSRG